MQEHRQRQFLLHIKELKKSLFFNNRTPLTSLQDDKDVSETVFRRFILLAGRPLESGATVSERGLGTRAAGYSATAGCERAQLRCLCLRGLSTASKHPAKNKMYCVRGGLAQQKPSAHFASKNSKKENQRLS